VYVVDTGAKVGDVGRFCAVIVSVPVVGKVAGAVYVIATCPALSEPKRWGASVIFAKSKLVKLSTPVAVPPPPAELVNDRSTNAPGTGCGVGVELSTAVTVKVVVPLAASEPVGAIGTALNT
jgi:hypothetical protein